MGEEKERKGEALAPIIHALCLTPSHPSSSACLSATTARGKCCSCCRHSLIIIRNPQQAGPVVSLRQCTGFASAMHVDEAENLTPVQSSSWSQHRDFPERKERQGEGSVPWHARRGLFHRPQEHRRLHTHAHTHRQAHLLTHARTQPLGAAPRSSLICKEGNKTS